MARGDFPFHRHGLNLRPIVVRPRVRAEVGVPLNDRGPGGTTCRSRRQSALHSLALSKARRWRMSSYSWTAPGSAWTAACVQRKDAGGGRDGGSGRIASRCVEIPLVGSGGEVSGILCHTGPVVADDWEGMPEEILSQAFTPYLTTKAARSGTGLGLLQVQRSAEGRAGANTWRPVQRWSS